MPVIVGLTGGIGSGKSTVARLISIMGFPVYNSDDRARFLQDNDDDLRREVTNLLGADAYKQGHMDRQLVAKMVFGNPELLQKLNRIVHPAVGHDFKSWVQDQKADVVFKESALLVETGLYKSCDVLVVVTAPDELRIGRVMMRDKVNEKAVRERMDRQASEEKKRELADYEIVNDDTQLLIPQVERLLSNLKHIGHV